MGVSAGVDGAFYLGERALGIRKPTMNWFKRHLNWTWVFAYLIWFPLNATALDHDFHTIPSLIGSGFLLGVSIWVIKQKGRRLAWVLLTPFFSPLWLGNKKTQPTATQAVPLIQRTRTATGRFVKILGWILWLGCGLFIFIWSLDVFFDAFGTWITILLFVFYPVAFVAAIPIAWFRTGTFPLHILIPYLLTYAGPALIYAGRRMRREEEEF